MLLDLTPLHSKKGRGGAIKAKPTPRKRAKESDSDEEVDEGYVGYGCLSVLSTYDLPLEFPR